MSENYLVDGPVTNELISVILGKLNENACTGGHSIFIGQVRADITQGKKVEAIEYSAYYTMVKEEADKIIRNIYDSFPDVSSVRILHSTGIVKTGENSLFVLVSAGHRSQAIEACSRIVELIKEKLPVWKKEIFEDNTHSWKNNNPA